MEEKKTESIEDIYLQQKILEAAASLHYEIKGQDTLDTLLFLTKQCIPEVCKTVLKEYKERS